MRSFAFNILFWIVSGVFAIACAPLALFPSRKPLMAGLQGYTRSIMFLMRWVAGIRVRIAGREKLAACAPAIIAAKHQSYGDGIVMFSQIFDLAFVTGDHLERFPLLPSILKKAGAVVVAKCGGTDSRQSFSETTRAAFEDGRNILIYPEGHLSKVGEQHRYRGGVYHMYNDSGMPVVPVATNLGLTWPRDEWGKKPGEAVIEFLDPILPGKDKQAFMQELESVIEGRSLALAGLDATAPRKLAA